MTTADAPQRILISYDESDTPFATWLSDSLRALGHQVWTRREDMVGGASTFDSIQKALDDSDIMLLLVTPNSLRSRRVKSEWTYFFCECEKPLIPLLVEPLTPPLKINFMLASLQYVDFYRDHPDVALNALHRALVGLHSETVEDERDQVLRGVSSSYQIPPRWSRKDELPTASAGLERVHLGMPLDLYANWLQQASTCVRILSNWTGIFADQGDLILKAAARGVSIQVMLLDPSSPLARQRSYDLYLGRGDVVVDEEEVPRNIRSSIRQLASLLGGDTGAVELRLYNAMPSFSVHQSDQHALIGFFPHAERTVQFPLLEILIDSPFGVLIDEEFTRLWKAATPVDLTPQFAERILAANQTLIEPLSNRELEILRLITSGLSNPEIAHDLVVVESTVKRHINNLYGKLQVNNRARAIKRAHELNLL
jgi:DNA-binding CsgD family transcriptional regulator